MKFTEFLVMDSVLNINHFATGLKCSNLRLRAMVCQKDMAKLMKVSAPMLCDLEQGKRKWNPNLAHRAIKALKL